MEQHDDVNTNMIDQNQENNIIFLQNSVNSCKNYIFFHVPLLHFLCALIPSAVCMSLQLCKHNRMPKAIFRTNAISI